MDSIISLSPSTHLTLTIHKVNQSSYGHRKEDFHSTHQQYLPDHRPYKYVTYLQLEQIHSRKYV